jgi:ABC-type antimicrobial peptide transport system permease subunit
MNILNITRINLRKLRFYPGKSAFLIIPIVLLVTLSVVLSSQSTNLLAAAEQAIFGSANTQNQYLTISKNQSVTSAGGQGNFVFKVGGNSSDQNYTETDLDKVTSTEHVSAAQIISALPVSNAKVSDLFDGKTFNVNALAGLSPELGSQYTDQGFNYTEGEPIPIVLNARSFNEMYEDWQGKTSVDVQFKRPTRGADGMVSPPSDLPVKNRAINYDKNSLIGKTFTMSVGGLDSIQDYTTTPSSSGVTYTQLTAAELATKEQTRKNAISPYWNYDKLNTPLKYTFKVVGVIEEQGNFDSYIPEAFAQKLMYDYIQNQVNARTSTTLTADILNANFRGIAFDGVELKSGGISGFGGAGAFRIEFRKPGASNDTQAEQYNIPGLLVSAARDDTSNNPFAQPDATGYLNDPDVYTKAAKVGSNMAIKLDDFKNRAAVVKSLNDQGYAYQDQSKSSVYDELATNLRTISILFVIAFVVISIAVVIFTMSKFVSESKKEIGIFRALGATRALVLRMFLLQAVLYGVIAYILGLGLGVGITLAAASPVNAWFDNFISRTVGQTLNVVNKVDSSLFSHIDWRMIGIYSALLLVILIVISLLPANRAANMKPVEAIRGE